MKSAQAAVSGLARRRKQSTKPLTRRDESLLALLLHGVLARDASPILSSIHPCLLLGKSDCSTHPPWNAAASEQPRLSQRALSHAVLVCTLAP